jgi:hypothetical protein
MQLLKIFIERILRKQNINPLGRWKLEYDTKLINNKIDLSNEDHCGPCGQYIIEKSYKEQKKNMKK